MFIWDAVLEAVDLVFTLQTFLWLVIGVVLGVAVGALPGMGTSAGMALALPFTFLLPAGPAIGLLMGLYKGGVYGGSITAIGFGIPGTDESAASVYDGYKMTQAGHGRKAMDMALYSSVFGDLSGSIATILLTVPLAMFALQFGPSERFFVAILAILLIGAVAERHFVKGLISAALGVFLATMGPDPISGVSRVDFGQWWLAGGVHIIPVVYGLIAMPLIFSRVVKLLKNRDQPFKPVSFGAFWKTGPRLTWKEWYSCRKEIGIGTGIGIFSGLLPGLGATPAAFITYGVAKQASPEKKIGTGVLAGVAAPEVAENASVGPALIPLLALGIPGSGGAALIGLALTSHGATPSPQLLDLFPEIVYALFLLLLLGNFVLLGIGRFFTRFYASFVNLPEPVLMPMILVLCLLGTFNARGNPYDIVVLLVLGFIGFLMASSGIPSAPAIIAYLVTPIAEANLRRALLINGGNWFGLLKNPLAWVLIAAAVVLFFLIFKFVVSSTGMEET